MHCFTIQSPSPLGGLPPRSLEGAVNSEAGKSQVIWRLPKIMGLFSKEGPPIKNRAILGSIVGTPEF